MVTGDVESLEALTVESLVSTGSSRCSGNLFVAFQGSV